MFRIAETHDPLFYRKMLGFPDDLPNLSRLCPPSNAKPRGIAQSFHTQRERCFLLQDCDATEVANPECRFSAGISGIYGKAEVQGVHGILLATATGVLLPHVLDQVAVQ